MWKHNYFICDILLKKNLIEELETYCWKMCLHLCISRHLPFSFLLKIHFFFQSALIFLLRNLTLENYSYKFDLIKWNMIAWYIQIFYLYACWRFPDDMFRIEITQFYPARMTTWISSSRCTRASVFNWVLVNY